MLPPLEGCLKTSHLRDSPLTLSGLNARKLVIKSETDSVLPSSSINSWIFEKRVSPKEFMILGGKSSTVMLRSKF